MALENIHIPSQQSKPVSPANESGDENSASHAPSLPATPAEPTKSPPVGPAITSTSNMDDQVRERLDRLCTSNTKKPDQPPGSPTTKKQIDPHSLHPKKEPDNAARPPVILRPVPFATPAIPSNAVRWYPTPSIRVAMPEDAARVLIALLDSHLGEVASLAFEAGPIDPEEYLHGDFCKLAETSMALVTKAVHELANTGIESGLDAVHSALDRTLSISLQHPHLNLESALQISKTILEKYLSNLHQARHCVAELQSGDTAIREAASDAAHDLAKFTHLQREQEYLGALRLEDQWMTKMLDILGRQTALLRRVERAGIKQQSLVDGLSQSMHLIDSEFSKLASIVDTKLQSVSNHVGKLAGVRERVRIAVSTLEEEWQAKLASAEALRQESQEDRTYVPMTPWLLEFCGLFLHMERMLARESLDTAKDAAPTTKEDPRSAPSTVVTRMLLWYSESKAGNAADLHSAMTKCLHSLNAHAECLTLLRRATEWAVSASLAQSRQGLNTLSGHATHLQSSIPATYEELHSRLIINEQLCKHNLCDMQQNLQRVLHAKNRAFEQRRVADLSRCDAEAAHLHAALEKEEQRQVEIEHLMQRAFSLVNRFLDADRVVQLQKEYLDLGVLLKFSTSTMATGKRSFRSIKSPSSASSSSTARPGGIEFWDVEHSDDGNMTETGTSRPVYKAPRLLGTSTVREASALWHARSIDTESRFSFYANLVRQTVQWSTRWVRPVLQLVPFMGNAPSAGSECHADEAAGEFENDDLDELSNEGSVKSASTY